MKKLLIALLFPVAAQAIPIADIGSEYQQRLLISGRFGNPVRYDIAFTDQNLTIDVDVRLYGDYTTPAQRNVYTRGVNEYWSNAFDIYDGEYRYDTVFNLNLVEENPFFDVEITGDITRQYNVQTWHYGASGRNPAHEFGHMIGLYDEYPDGAVNPYTGLIILDSLMGNGEKVYEHHFTRFIDWLGDKSGRELSLLADAGDNYYTVIPGAELTPIEEVPEPGALGLVGLALAALSIRKRQHSI